MSSIASKNVFVFRISLRNSKPEIWRRVLVPGDYTFKNLHEVIIKVMGWSNFHLHKFRMKHPMTEKDIEIGGVGDLGYGDYLWLPESTKIAHYFISPKQKAVYEYDFGSPWYHIVLFEKTIPAVPGKKYPLCIGGKRATTPEEDPGSDYSESDQETEFFDPESIIMDGCRDFLQDTSSQEIDDDDAPLQQSNSDINNIEESSFHQSIDIIPQAEPYHLEEESEDSNKLPEDSKRVHELDFDGKSQPVVLPLKRKQVEVESSDLQDVQRIQNYVSELSVKNASDVSTNGAFSRKKPSESGMSIMSRLENDVDEDIEDAYGKYVASQMRLISDLKAREELRIEIQKAIKKYRFKRS